MSAKDAQKVRGLFTALLTPFDGDGRVAADRIADLVEFQLSKGAEGLYPCGTTGLGPMLSVDERKLVAEAVVSSTRGRMPVVVHVGCADTASTVELARHAERAGADAVASLTPYYYKPGDVAVVRHFEAVSRAVGIPLFAYNIPQFTGNNLLPKAVAELASNGVIAGVKDSSRDLLQLQDLMAAVPDGFVVMNGTEEYALYAIMSGADGLVSGAATAMPDAFKPMVSAQREGDLPRAAAAQGLIHKVKEAVRAAPIPSYYAILRARGVDCGVPRAPFLPLSSEAAGRVVSSLKGLGVL